MSQRDACEKVIEALVAALGPGDARTLTLTAERNSNSMEPFIIAVLSDHALDVRVIAHAIWLSRLFPSSAIVEAITNTMRERPELAMVGGATLAQLGTKYDLSVVAEGLLDRSSSVPCKIGAARALSGWRDPRAGEFLRRSLFADGQDALVLREVIQALAWAQIGRQAKGAAEDIRAFLHADSPDVRHSAILALGNLGAATTVKDIAGLVKDIAGLLNDNGVTVTGRSVSAEAERVVRLFEGA